MQERELTEETQCGELEGASETFKEKWHLQEHTKESLVDKGQSVCDVQSTSGKGLFIVRSGRDQTEVKALRFLKNTLIDVPGGNMVLKQSCGGCRWL